MTLIRRIFDEALGLFVDDGAYAGSIVVWLIGMAVLVRFTVFGLWSPARCCLSVWPPSWSKAPGARRG